MSKHDKFIAYWRELGCPELEVRCSGKWYTTPVPSFFEDKEYRIAGDRHYELRRQWIDSDFELPIQISSFTVQEWMPTPNPLWLQDMRYRVNPSTIAKEPTATPARAPWLNRLRAWLKGWEPL